MLDPPGDSCRRTHQVVRHLRAGIAAGGIVCLIHAVHDDRCDATTVPRDLGGREEGRADANARNTEVGSLARSTGSERMDRDLHAKLCTDRSTHMDARLQHHSAWGIAFCKCSSRAACDKFLLGYEQLLLQKLSSLTTGAHSRNTSSFVGASLRRSATKYASFDACMLLVGIVHTSLLQTYSA